MYCSVVPPSASGDPASPFRLPDGSPVTSTPARPTASLSRAVSRRGAHRLHSSARLLSAPAATAPVPTCCFRRFGAPARGQQQQQRGRPRTPAEAGAVVGSLFDLELSSPSAIHLLWLASDRMRNGRLRSCWTKGFGRLEAAVDLLTFRNEKCKRKRRARLTDARGGALSRGGQQLDKKGPGPRPPPPSVAALPRQPNLPLAPPALRQHGTDTAPPFFSSLYRATNASRAVRSPGRPPPNRSSSSLPFQPRRIRKRPFSVVHLQRTPTAANNALLIGLQARLLDQVRRLASEEAGPEEGGARPAAFGARDGRSTRARLRASASRGRPCVPQRSHRFEEARPRWLPELTNPLEGPAWDGPRASSVGSRYPLQLKTDMRRLLPVPPSFAASSRFHLPALPSGPT